VRARHALDAVRLDGATRYNAELVFEEVVANVVGHGAPDGHALEVRFTLEIRADSIILTFDDNGVPFDPRGRADPPPQKSLDEARIGGYGLMRAPCGELARLPAHDRRAQPPDRAAATLRRGGDGLRRRLRRGSEVDAPVPPLRSRVRSGREEQRRPRLQGGVVAEREPVKSGHYERRAFLI